MEENNKEFIKYIELETEDGPLYLYEKYKTDPNEKFNHEIPETREFFTQLEGIRSFNCITFLDRKCEFEWDYISFMGEHIKTYRNEISPYEFLMKVAPFLKDEETLKNKREEVMNILEFKAKLVNHRKVKLLPPEISEEQKNEVSQKVLKRYIK